MKSVKDIVKGNYATFSHAIAGVLYYRIESDGEIYLFPVDMNDRDDVGTSTFDARIKAITLMRYVNKAIAADTLVCLK